MGNRNELCLTVGPADADPEAIERRLAAELDGEDVEAPPVSYDGTYRFERDDFIDWDWATSKYGFEDLHVTREAGRVYVYGITYDETELRIWWEAVLSMGLGDGWALAVYTHEAGYGGYGCLYDWDHRRGQYVEVDTFDAPEGGYDGAVKAYVRDEHDLFARTFSDMQLDDLPDR